MIENTQATNKNETQVPLASSLTVGGFLKAQREKLGINLKSTADELCIRYIFLKAIEAGKYEELPGSAYAVGFVRSYAEYLGLDGEKTVARFKEEISGIKKEDEYVMPEPVSEAILPSNALVILGFVAVIVVIALWYSFFFI